jgi:ABC-type glycerol-3-phosphate transport system substrate-binding protein
MKRLSMGAACAALAMLAVGCGSASSSGGSKTSVAGAGSFGVNAKGTVVFYQRAASNALALALVPKFNATHPGLKVRIVQTSPNNDTSTLATAIRAGHPPDLVGLNDVDVPEFTSEHTLMNLTPYIKALPQLKALSPGHLSLGNYQGRAGPVTPATLTAIPYHAWANRGVRAMRVWVPLSGAGPD